jgi:hypothetical protein
MGISCGAEWLSVIAVNQILLWKLALNVLMLIFAAIIE